MLTNRRPETFLPADEVFLQTARTDKPQTASAYVANVARGTQHGRAAQTDESNYK